MAECICFELPPEMHITHYGATEPGSIYEPNPDCLVHFARNRQTCKDCNGTGETEKLFDGIMTWLACCTCDGNWRINRTGPYRLADGTWSDGVERTHVIPSHEFSKANPDRIYVHTSYDPETLGKWQPLFDVWQGDAMLECELSFDEAIAYADRMARTNQGENK